MNEKVIMGREKQEQWQNLWKGLYSQGWKQGWKVLISIGGKYYSPIAHPKDGNYGRFLEGRLEYPLGEKVVPEEGCGPLCVYSDPLSASRQKGGSTVLHVFICLFKPSEETKVWNKYDESEAELSSLQFGSVLTDELIVIPLALGINGNPNNIGERSRGPWIV